MNYFKFEGLYYIKIIPWELDWDIQLNINSIKWSLNALHLKWVCFWLDIFITKTNNINMVEQYAYSNHIEWISYLINIYKNLFSKKIAFSTIVNEDLIKSNRYTNKYQVSQVNNWLLQIKKMGSVGWSNYETSLSLNNSIINDYIDHMENNNVIYISFSFTKWTYNRLIKNMLYILKSINMDENERDSLYDSFTDSQYFFQFRYIFKSNIANPKIFENVIVKNLQLYDSPYNRYILKKKNWMFDVTAPWKKIAQQEAFLSQWLCIPVLNDYCEKQDLIVITPCIELINAWFIYKI